MNATSTHNKILITDDDSDVLEALEDLFSDDYKVVTALSGSEALGRAKDNLDICVCIMDIKMAGMDGIETAREVRKLLPGVPIIFHTGYPGEYNEDSIDKAEKPFDFILKGESLTKLMRSVRNAAESCQLRLGNHTNSGSENLKYGLVGDSLTMNRVRQLIRKVSESDTKVMILGETGTGKELVAKAIHANSTRSDKRLGFLNCNHKSPDIIESELFGHLKGAFTGAVSNRLGLFEYADGGTVFLDEIGDLDITTQAKLLRVIEAGEYTRIGSSEVFTCDVRIVCATHRNLEQMVEEDKFRQDLYYRLKGVVIKLPPLRERREDIPQLLSTFIDRFTIERGLPPRIFDQSAVNALIDYDWPGNVRQLLDTIESVLVLSDSDMIFADDVISLLNTESSIVSQGNGSLTHRVRGYERTQIIQALAEAKNNIAEAARNLKIDRANLSRKIKLHGISIPDTTE